MPGLRLALGTSAIFAVVVACIPIIAVGVADMVLAATMASDGTSATCVENYQTYLWVRGPLGIALSLALAVGVGFFGTGNKAGWVVGIPVILTALLVGLALAGVNIWGLVITYRPDGTECMISDDYSERMVSLWINITCWLMSGIKVTVFGSVFKTGFGGDSD